MKNLKAIYRNVRFYDCYTIIAKDGSCFGMSYDAKGFNIYIGELNQQVYEGKHLGKKLNHIPNTIYEQVKERITQ